MPDFDFGILSTSKVEVPDGVDAFFSGDGITPITTPPTPPPATPPPATTPPPAAPPKKEESTTPPPAKVDEDEFFKGKKPKEGEEGKSEEGEGNEEDDENDYEALSKNLYELGIFVGEQDEQGNEIVKLANTGEELKTLWEEQKLAAAESTIYNFLSAKHGEEGIKIFEDIFQNGVSPKEYFAVYNQIQDLSALDPTKEADQEAIIREEGKRRNIPADKVEKKIQRLKDIASLQEEAEDLLPILIEENNKELANKVEAEKQKEERIKQQDVLYKTALTKSLQEKLKAKEFDGIPLNDQSANEVFDFLYTKKFKAGDGTLLTEFDVFMLESKKPDKINDRIKIALLAKNGFDFSKIQKKAVSEESKKIFKDLVKKKITSSKPDVVEDNWKL